MTIGYNPLKRNVDMIAVRVGVAAFVITADNTRNVRTVVGIRRIYIGIVVRIVIRERHFVANKYVAYRQRPRAIFRHQVFRREHLRHVFFRPRIIDAFRLEILERRVGVVQTGVEYGNDHFRAVFFRVLGRIVNTGIVYLRGVERNAA